MKHICIVFTAILLASVLPLTAAPTDFYATHWQNVEHALKNDLPASALKELSVIRQRALRENNMPQLCRALFTTMQCQTEISPDSLEPCRERIEAAMQKETRPVQHAVYQHLLGRSKNDTTLLHAALADLTLLADAKTDNFLPLIEPGTDAARYFNNDLLHIFLSNSPGIALAPYIHQARKIYDERGLNTASLLLLQYLPIKSNELYTLWRAAADKNPALLKVGPIASLIYNTEAQSISLYTDGEQTAAPGHPFTLVATARNITVATLQIAGRDYSMHFPETAPWETRTDTLHLCIQEPGIYKATLSAGKLSTTDSVHISAVKPLIFALPDKRCRISMVDAITGRPLSDIRLIRRNKTTHKSVTFCPAADGYIYLNPTDYNWTNTHDCEFYPMAGNDTFHQKMPHWTFSAGYYHKEGDIEEHPVRLFTDRGIFRPGQKVQVGVLAYQRHNDAYEVSASDTLTLHLFDADHREIATDTIVTDIMGSAATEFSISPHAKPGYFFLEACRRKNIPEGSTGFSVEAYKRPTFEVKFDAFTEDFQAGDTARVSGIVKTLTGFPLADTPVRTSLGDTLITDAEGCFAFDVRVEATLYKFWRGQNVSVDVTASNGETATASFRIPLRWRKEDTTAPTNKRLLPFWESSSVSSDGSTATLTVGSCYSPCTAFVDVLAADRIVEHRIVEFTDSFTYSLKYRETWGDGATCHIAFVREGELHSASVSVVRPRPNKSLSLRWGTFRSNLQPGQEERWTLYVSKPDGTPADALVMARMYDAALDAFTSNEWQFGLDFFRNLPSAYWRTVEWDFRNMFLASSVPTSKTLKPSRWRNTLETYGRTNGVRMYASTQAPMNVKIRGNNSGLESAKMADMAMPTGNVPTEKPKLRENFDETAFFLPALRTDKDGHIGIEFRLPESLTTWCFTALAHDAQMNYGILNDTIVARKQLMAEIAAPRFLRDGDSTEIPLTLTNLTDTTQHTVLTFCINNDAQQQDIILAAHERRTLAFPFIAHAPEGGSVVFRALLQGKEFQDGEERNVPILSNLTEVTRSIPYSLTEAGTKVLDLSPLWSDTKKATHIRMVREECTNPMAQVADALKPIYQEKEESTTALAIRLYALRIANFLRSAVPDTVAARWDKLSTNAIQEELILQQKSDGSWSWFKDMPSSTWVTTDICTLLARLQILTTDDTSTVTMIEKALPYLHKEMAEHIQDMKAYEKKHKTTLPLSDSHLRYLYLCMLTQQKVSADIRYLLEKLLDAKHTLTMYGKAHQALILQHYGSTENRTINSTYDKTSALSLKSLIEHTVFSDEMGRYFDTDRAISGWYDYKIPTQTAAIEAVLQGKKIPEKEKLLAELRLWLLQCKRTQKWVTSRATLDAIYALLTGDNTLRHAARNESGISSSTETFASTDNLPQSLTIRHTGGTPMWGAILAKYLVPFEEVNESHSGMILTRHIEVPEGGYKVGQRIRITYTLKTERDMDFVSIRAYRAACMEPTKALSGYDWHNGCYRAVFDQYNDYFFEHLAKGSHTFSEEVLIDRAGTFGVGYATAECMYAPEYRSSTRNAQLVVSTL